MKVVDYDILVQELIPPIDGMIKYFAVINFLVIETKGGNKRISPSLGKTHGETQEEARNKMQAKYDGWFSQNSYLLSGYTFTDET